MGTIGSGKTTAARLLSEKLNYHLLEENFGENAFLPRFYQDMPRWAFHSQTFFLMEKITQMLDTKTLMQKHPVIQDTPLQQDVFSYAKAQHMLGHIDDAEWKLYLKIYRSFEPYFPVPDLIIYMETPVTSVISRIKQRGREYEQEIPQSYLELLEMLNHKWVSEQKRIPVCRIQTDTLNIVRNKTAKDMFVQEISAAIKKI